MKKTFLIIALLTGALVGHNAQAQVSVNIGIQPIWGPVGYDHADYYYMPDIDAYYDVPAHVYVYQDGGVWVRRASLPPRYANFDVYHSYKAVINVPQPWLHHDVYRNQYASYKGRHDQVVIRDSREPKYYEIKDHPMHGQYHSNNHVEEHHEEHHEDHHGEHHGDHR